MNHIDMTKQILTWNQTMFESTATLFETLQDYAEKTAGSCVDLSSWGAEAGKKVLDQWSSNRKKGFKAFRDSATFGFKQMEGFCAAAKPAK